MYFFEADNARFDHLFSKVLILFTYCYAKMYTATASIFMKYSYKGTKKATNNFSTIIGQGGFGTVYKAEFKDGSIVAVKRMKKVSEQAEDEFCREIELLARLHHRHLVALRGFCSERHERFGNHTYQFLYLFFLPFYVFVQLSMQGDLLTSSRINIFFSILKTYHGAGFSCMNICQMEA